MRPAVAVLAALICALIALQADAQLAVRRTTARALRLALPTTSRRPTTTRTATTSRTKTATRTRTSTTKPVKLNPTPPAAPFLYNGYDADGQIIKTAVG